MCAGNFFAKLLVLHVCKSSSAEIKSIKILKPYVEKVLFLNFAEIVFVLRSTFIKSCDHICINCFWWQIYLGFN